MKGNILGDTSEFSTPQAMYEETLRGDETTVIQPYQSLLWWGLLGKPGLLPKLREQESLRKTNNPIRVSCGGDC